MSFAKRIEARRTNSADVVSSTGGGRRALPDDLLRGASRRLEIVCLVGIGLWVLGNVLYHVLDAAMLMPMTHRAAAVRTNDIITLLGVAFNLGLYLYARSGARDPVLILNLGLALEVATAAVLGYMTHFLFPVPSDSHGLTWIAPLVLIFAALVPSVPRYTAIAAFSSAMMDPLTYLLAERINGLAIAGSTVASAFLRHFPDFLCAGVAVVISHVITGLGRQVRKARELGSYELDVLLGSGGMGEVWRANHRLLARPAAIKLIRPERLHRGSTQDAMVLQSRFKREAQAAAQLRSPHTIELFDFGVTHDGTFYFVMELLDGLDLDKLVQKFGPLPAARTVRILRQVCDSLGEAHEQGLVHRDVKPANIHLCRMGLQVDYAKVLDFGLVKREHTAMVDQTKLTAPDITAGTPAFMPPEMALGEEVDRRADIYALGCVGYWLLTGRLVFDAETSIQMVARHVQQKPVPPSQKTELPVPPELDRLIL